MNKKTVRIISIVLAGVMLLSVVATVVISLMGGM